MGDSGTATAVRHDCLTGSQWNHGPLRNHSSSPELTCWEGQPAEEPMRLLALTVATATVLTFAFSQKVLAQGHDDGAVGPTLRLDGGPPLGTDNRGQTSSRPESTAPSAGTALPSAGTASAKSRTRIEKTGENAIRGRSKTHSGWRFRPRHRFAFHRRGHHVFAFHVPRHRFVIHRHARRFVAFNDSSGVSRLECRALLQRRHAVSILVERVGKPTDNATSAVLRDHG
jgi:hypothetical protein